MGLSEYDGEGGGLSVIGKEAHRSECDRGRQQEHVGACLEGGMQQANYPECVRLCS